MFEHYTASLKGHALRAEGREAEGNWVGVDILHQAVLVSYQKRRERCLASAVRPCDGDGLRFRLAHLSTSVLPLDGLDLRDPPLVALLRDLGREPGADDLAHLL